MMVFFLFSFSPENILQKCQGKDLTLDYLSKKGFRKPVLVEKKNGLGMIVPDSAFSVGDVEKYVGKRLLFF